MKLFSTSNSKLAKDNIVSFGLPAFRSKKGFKTCPMAGACATGCYARQGLVEIALNGKDLYDIRLLKMRKGMAVIVDEVADVYAEDMMQVLEFKVENKNKREQ